MLFSHTQALGALVSCLNVETEGQEKERRHSYLSPLRKRRVLALSLFVSAVSASLAPLPQVLRLHPFATAAFVVIRLRVFFAHVDNGLDRVTRLV
jgi:hypothetical protein